MNTLRLIKIAGSAIALSSFVMSHAAADTSHTTKVACYASVQTQCYGNGQNNCTSEEYQEGLGWCDEYYPIAVGPHGASTNLKTTQTRSPKVGTTR